MDNKNNVTMSQDELEALLKLANRPPKKSWFSRWKVVIMLLGAMFWACIVVQFFFRGI